LAEQGKVITESHTGLPESKQPLFGLAGEARQHFQQKPCSSLSESNPNSALISVNRAFAEFILAHHARDQSQIFSHCTYQSTDILIETQGL
jgi:hypothetical protein